MGHLSPAYTSEPLGTTYQLAKFIKHTTPNPSLPVQSVFDSNSTQKYASYIVEASLSGSVEFDDKGRKNIIWAAGEPTGFQLQNGRLVRPQDGVKVVLSTETQRIHAYPQNSTTFTSGRCFRCGGPVLY